MCHYVLPIYYEMTHDGLRSCENLKLKISVSEKQVHEAQLTLFSAKDNSGNSLVDYDQLPRFLHAMSKKFFTPEEHAVNPYKEIVVGEKQVFQIRPAELDGEDGSFQGRKYVYPSTREALVEEVIIDFARNGVFSWERGEPGYLHSETGAIKVIFTMYQLRKRLEAMKKSYRVSELTEALRVLRRATYRRFSSVNVEVGKKWFNRVDKEFSYIAELGFLERVDENTPIKSEAVVEVTLSEQASQKIITGDYRSYNCSMSLSFKSPMSRYIYKMISQKWRNATMKSGNGNSFTLPMNMTLNDAGHACPANITKRRAIVEKALEELHKSGVIQEIPNSHVHIKKRGAKIVDIVFLVMPQEGFVKQQILANVRYKEVNKIKSQLPMLTSQG